MGWWVGLLVVGLAMPRIGVAEEEVGASPEELGSVILQLVASEAPDADERLQALAGEGQLELVQAWAHAAQIQRADAVELPLLASHALEHPVLIPLWSQRTVGLGVIDVAIALRVYEHDPELAAPLEAWMRGLPWPRALELMLTADGDEARRLMAGVLSAEASQALRSGPIVAAVVEHLAYRSVGVHPWGDGALFLPALDWPEAEARLLVTHLLRWQRRLHEDGAMAPARQVRRTLGSPALLRAAGLLSGAWGSPRGRSSYPDLRVENTDALLQQLGQEDAP